MSHELGVAALGCRSAMTIRTSVGVRRLAGIGRGLIPVIKLGTLSGG